MAKVLLATLGSRGDVQPFLALGILLRARGHDVTVATGEGFEQMFEGTGLALRTVPVNVSEMLKSPELRNALKSWRGLWRAYRDNREMMVAQYGAFHAIASDVAPDVIVYHPKVLGTVYTARARGIIAIPAFLQPAYVPTHEHPPGLFLSRNPGASVNRLLWWALGGLMRLATQSLVSKWLRTAPEVPASPRLDIMDGYRPDGKPAIRLHAHSRHIVPVPKHWGEREQVTGAWMLADVVPRDYHPSAELERFLASGPVIYVGFGSMPALDGEATAAIVVEAVRAAGVRAVVAKGWGGLADVNAADDIFVVDHIPHRWLFPRCRGVIHHGGAGTTHEGLRCGRPTLVCYVFGDQPFWAGRVQTIGAGPQPLSIKTLDAARLGVAIRAMFAPEITANARRIGEMIADEHGVKRAADLVEAALKAA